MYLLTCPHGTIAGVFRLPDGYACEDLQWSTERVQEAFVELFANGFANRCETTKWVWVVKHLDWNPPENPNQRKSAAKVAGQVPDECAWKLEFTRVCGPSLGIFPPEEFNGYETVPERLANQYQEQKQEQEQEQEEHLLPPASTPAQPETLPAVANAPATQVKPAADTALQAACRETWQAYGQAYADRYSVAPIRNGKVNAQVKQLVQRLGAEESPLVASWFVGHPGGFYVQKMHDIGTLLADAEKLRTEWATGRVMTTGKARQSDRAGTTMAALAEVLAEQGEMS